MTNPCILYIARRFGWRLQPIFRQFVNLINHNTIQWYSRWNTSNHMLSEEKKNEKLINNVQIPVNCIYCSLFSILGCSLEMKRFNQITWQRKTDVKFWSYCKLVNIQKIPLKTVERLKLVGKADFLLTSLHVWVHFQTIYIYIYIYIYIHICKFNNQEFVWVFH